MQDAIQILKEEKQMVLVSQRVQQHEHLNVVLEELSTKSQENVHAQILLNQQMKFVIQIVDHPQVQSHLLIQDHLPILLALGRQQK